MVSSSGSLVLSVLAVIACSPRADDPDRGATSEHEGSVARESSVSSGGGGVAPATIHLVLSGGPHAGTYDVDTKTRTCSHGLIRKAAWGHMFSDDGAKPSSVQLLVPDATQAAAGTETFSFRVSFGDPLTGTHYVIDRTHGGRDGDGTATVTDRGSSATMKIVGRSKEGVDIDASIECRDVHRVPDEQW